MPNINDMINNMPQIQRRASGRENYMGAMNDFSGMTQNMAQLMSMQMGMVNKELQSTQELHRTLGALVKKLDSLIEKNDTPGFTSKVSSCMTDIVGSIEQLSERLESPNINVDFPNDDLKAMKKAIEALKFEGIEEVTVKNISDVTKAVNELKPLLVNLEQAIEVEKKTTEAVQLDPKSLKYLKYLENLDTDAKNPLAVRLSDGKEFINQLKSVDSGIRAMTGSSGNNFLTSTGSPTKANLDSSGNLRVALGSDPAVTNAGTFAVQIAPSTSGGWSTFHLVSAASTNATSVKASAGQLGGWYIYNSNAAALKIAFHNTAGTPTAGSSVFMSVVIPPTAGANVEFTAGIPFSTGIGITTVTGLADSDATAVAANDLVINLFYK